MIDTCFVKTTASIAAATPTTAYDILVGAPGAEGPSGFTTVPQAVSRFALGAGAWALLHRVNDAWELVPYANHCYHVTLAITIGAGSSGSVTLPDGRIVTATNWSADAALHSGDRCLCFQDLTNGAFYLINSGQGAEKTAVVSVYAEDADEGNCLWPGKVMTTSGTPSGGCTNPFASGEDCWLLVLNSDGGSWQASKLTLKVGDHYIGRKVFSIGEDPVVDVYAVRHTPKPGTVIYKGTLAGTLLFGDATASVDNLSSYTELPAPSGTISADNVDHWAGASGDVCRVIQDNSVAPPTYELLSVEWDELERVTDVEFDTAGETDKLVEHKRKLLGKDTDSETDEDILSVDNQTVVSNVAYNTGTHALEKTTADVAVFTAGAPSTANILAAVAGEYVSDVDYTAGVLRQYTQEFYYLGEAGAANGPETILTAVEQTVVTDVSYETHALKETKAAVLVLFAGTPATTTVLAAFQTDVVVDLDFDSESGLDAIVKSVYLLGEDDGAPDTVEVANTTTVAPVYDVAWNGTTLSETPVTLKILGSASVGSPSTVFTTTTKAVVENIDVDGTAMEIRQDFTVLQVFAFTAGTQNDVVHTGDDCEGE